MRDLLRMLKDDRWQLKNQEGSHRQFIHPDRAGKVTVTGHPSDEIAPGTLKSIMRQAEMEKK